MIPIKLSLRNFMPYSDNVKPLDFRGIHTASIWGDNGNGKSAIIDAMTWALWGKTRARSDDDLIHQGKNEMEVEFDFSVSDQEYRVIRKRARAKSQRGQGQSSLEFQVALENGYRPLTGTSIRETEQKIRDTLHMDYDTFSNSAFLRQGHADEFTRQPPVKRKEVLANILGLELYDDLEARARDHARQREGQRNAAEIAIRDLKADLERKPEYEEELERAQMELAQLESLLKEKEAGLNDMRQKKELYESRRSQLTQLEKHSQESHRTLGLLDSQLEQLNSRISEFEALIGRRTEIEEKYAQYLEAKNLNSELDRKFRMRVNLNEQKNKLERIIDNASQSLLREYEFSEKTIGELETRLGKLPELKNELHAAQNELNGLAGEEENLNQGKQKSLEHRTSLNGLTAEKSRLEKEIGEIDEKLGLLSEQTGAVCPLCKQELGDEHRKLIEDTFNDEKRQKAASIELAREQAAQQSAELKSLESDVSRREKALEEQKNQAHRKAGLLEREISGIDEDGARLDLEKQKLAEIEERLAGKDFAAAEQEALSQFDDELSKLEYDPQKHEQLRSQLSGLEGYEEPKRKLEEADRLSGAEKETAARAEQAAGELRLGIEADSRRKEELTAELQSMPDLAADLEKAETEYRELSIRQKQSQEMVGSIKGRLERLSELETRMKEREKLVGQSSKEEAIYRDLAQAFGKRGIQAWLIELALPELEIETNKLLGRMTDNRMHVNIETQRETKKGDTMETLDIMIADELGTRDYEMFSGGEAFRIDFAIRIALSKLLARRAGAPPLRTLIIDEGFGTQDSTGLEKLIEAITSIQDDFEKIIVITHIEELRDAFPTRIDVVKTGDGSTIEVS
ncbi:AAA family ATPase [Chloroflexota bacterium]